MAVPRSSGGLADQTHDVVNPPPARPRSAADMPSVLKRNIDGFLFLCHTQAMAPAKPPRRTQAQRTAATRSALLEATVECLVSQGFDGTTTTEVAHRAGVSPGALLHHFPAKADLLCAAVGHLFELRQAEFRKAMANLEPGADRVEAGVDLLWSMFSGPTFVAWLELWIAARCDPALAEAVVRLDREFIAASEAVFRELFAEEVAVRPDLAQVGIGLMFSQLAGLALFRLIPGHEPAPAADIITAFKTLVRAGLPTPEGNPNGNH
jgi:AcrR family transcriptional regulator